MRRVIHGINPEIVLIAETALWPNFFRELKRAGIPSIVINGRISPHLYKKRHPGAVGSCIPVVARQ